MVSSYNPAPETPGFWPWLLQRLSGVALVLLLVLHGWFTHFANVGEFRAGLQEEVVVWEVVKHRLSQAGFLVLDFSLLALVLYHGLNGVRTVLMEWRPTARRERAVTLLVWTIGLAALGYGSWSLVVFVL